MKRERRRSTGDHGRHTDALGHQMFPKAADEREAFFAPFLSNPEICVVNVTVVGVEARRMNVRQLGQEPVERAAGGTWIDARPMHPDIQIEEKVHDHVGLDRGLRQHSRVHLIVNERRERGAGKRADQTNRAGRC